MRSKCQVFNIPDPNRDGPKTPFRILFNTLNNMDFNEFTVTRKIIVSEVMPVSINKLMFKEMVGHFHSFGIRKADFLAQIRDCERLSKAHDTKKVQTALHGAVTRLFELNPDCYRRQSFTGKTFLHYFAYFGYTTLIRQIIGDMKPAEINLLDINNRNALFCAVEYCSKS